MLCDVGSVGSSPASGERRAGWVVVAQSAAKLSQDHRHLSLSLSLSLSAWSSTSVRAKEPVEYYRTSEDYRRDQSDPSDFYDLPRGHGQQLHQLQPGDDVGGGTGQPGPADSISLQPQRSRRTHPGEQSEYSDSLTLGHSLTTHSSFHNQAACLAPLCLVFPNTPVHWVPTLSGEQSYL